MSGPELLAAFTRARQAAERHMADSDADDTSWHEETITDLVLRAARPQLSYCAFHRRQEAQVGADWLWWWVQAGGECFGMLVQAKRMHRGRSGALTLDVRAGDGIQMTRLLTAADALRVPAVYVLYFGTPAWRAPRTCGTEPHPEPCVRCHRATVSVLTALQVQLSSLSGPSPGDVAATALTNAVPLEDLADPHSGAGSIVDVNLPHLDHELKALLRTQQSGVRHVARTVLALLAAARLGQASVAVAERQALGSDTVFSDMPDDTGHFSQPYYPYVLRGLRTSPPEYLAAALAGNPPPELAAHADGIVVVTL